MAALRQFFPVLTLLSASLAAACGGSSSETPPPLPPLALNEPYRARSAVEPRTVQAPAADEGDEELDAPRGAPGPSRTTWGSTAPEPLPELSPK